MFKLFSTSLKSTLPCLALMLVILSANTVRSQAVVNPEREQLLNGLRILFLPIPGSSTVTVKLRIHSGAAFDLAGKPGEMALLGDLLFPDPTTAEYFTSELGGRLDVNVNYDSTTITMIGKASEFTNIVEVLRNALLATTFTPDIVTKMRDGRIKIIRDTAVSPAMVADRAIANRLFGDFPYGRPATGSAEGLSRVERGDLMLAKERFINSNNATLAIIGGVQKATSMKILRQLLGPWRKSENVVPTTFRQPKPPDSRILIVNAPGEGSEIRLAVRGLSRSDQDFYAATVLARVVQYRWLAALPELAHTATFARSEFYTLPGQFVLGASVPTAKSIDALGAAKKVLESFATTPANQAEVDRAIREILSETKQTTPDRLADGWLDMDTYQLRSPEDRSVGLSAVSPGDVQRAATRIFKGAPEASVVVGDATQLKTAFQGKEFEVFGELPPTPPQAKPAVKTTPE